MIVQLRPYQLAAINSTRDVIASGIRRPLVVAPTASGKSMIIAGILKSSLENRKNTRLLVLCSQAEILEQNEKALLSMLPRADSGIYCAGLNRRETQNRIIFASRDSLGREPTICGRFNCIIVDEAHLVSTRADSFYGKIFSSLKPRTVIGFTGTPWRLDNGKIWGEKGFFGEIAYNIPMGLLVEQGYLSPHIFPEKHQVIIKTDGITKTSTGDFNLSQLSIASSSQRIVIECINVWEKLAADRRCSIFFCCSLAHADVVLDELAKRRHLVAYLDGSTSKGNRSEILQLARLGTYKAIVNVGVLTTGVDIPPIDCVVMLRATQSAALFVQSCGRGKRLSPGKKDCLILDMTDNFQRFGSLENPLAPTGIKPLKCSQCNSTRIPNAEKCWKCDFVFKKGKGITKDCPSCLTICSAGVSECPFCEHIFISHGSDYHVDIKAISGWFLVDSYTWGYQYTADGEPSAVIDFQIRGTTKVIKQWLLYKRSWNNAARRQIESMAIGAIDLIKIDDRTAKYPKVTNVLYSQSPPVAPFNKENTKVFFS
jgi:DNA repair protein RadD